MFNITSKYFSFFNNKPPAGWVAHITRNFLTCYSCSYSSSLVWLCKFKKKGAKCRKKMSFKKWQSRTCFLNDENPTHVVSPGKKKLIRPHVLKHQWIEAAFAVLIFVYTRRKKLELTFSNFLTVKKLELDFTNLFNLGKNNQHWIVYWSLGRRKVLMGCQLCNF